MAYHIIFLLLSSVINKISYTLHVTYFCYQNLTTDIQFYVHFCCYIVIEQVMLIKDKFNTIILTNRSESAAKS